MLPNTQHLVFYYQIVADNIIMLPNTQHVEFYLTTLIYYLIDDT
jgi:hypothetical protein